VTAYHAALEEWTRERVPLDWARTQMNLGVTLATMAERQKDAALVGEAIEAMRGSVEAFQQAGESYWLPIAQQRVREMQGELVELKR